MRYLVAGEYVDPGPLLPRQQHGKEVWGAQERNEA